jgi:hypothetical protein
VPTSTKFLQVARCSLFGPGGGSRVGTLELEGAQVHGCGDQRGACVTARDLVPLLDFSDPLNSSVVLTFLLAIAVKFDCRRASQPWRNGMFDVAEKVARYKLLRYAVMVAVVVPAALFAGCAQQPPPPPPPVVSQAPPPPPPPVVRGERG